MELLSLTSPKELHALQIEELEELAHEIRNQIISVSLKNGGHLGASLGAVELAIALHRIFESPKDKILWDVGHQAYAHKLLTGRAKAFQTLRQSGGLSGFLSRDESEHDILGAGHSSTSLSAALGTSYENPNWTVAVIGDGALTAGVALEALNQFSHLQKRGPILVVLNDNQMSISKNVGAIPEILRGSECPDFFAQFGFDYVGPVDGHNLGHLLSVLNGIYSSHSNQRPVLLHTLTQKGRGYFPAEEHPETYHGVSATASDKTEPQNQRPPPKKESSWSGLFCQAMIEKAKEDINLLAITAAMSEGTGLSRFFQTYPERSFDVGIAEPHAVTFAAGLAANEKKPVVAIYSTFLQRAIDPMIHDVALQKLDVLFAVDRAGIVGADGPTHHGVFDLVYASMIPGFHLFIPQVEEDFAPLFKKAFELKGPKLIRYPRGNAKRRGVELTSDEVSRGYRIQGASLKSAKKIVVSLGPIGGRIHSLLSEAGPHRKSSETIAHLQLLHYVPGIGPLQTALSEISHQAELFFYEEGIERGSLSEGIAARLPQKKTFRTLGNAFIPHGAMEDLEKKLRWDVASIRQDLLGET